MKMRYWIGLGLLLCAVAVGAANRTEVRKQVEASMVVTGTIDIEPDGSVSAHTVDRSEALPEGVTALLAQAIPGWRFEPVVVDGKPVPVRVKMGVRLVAKQKDDGDYLLGIRSANFGDGREAVGTGVVAKRMQPPRFPEHAARSGIAGTAFLVLRVNREGQVEDAVAERVNLRVVGSQAQMQRGRKVLADASLAAARRWTFTVPTTGPEADEAFWSVRVPVDYTFGADEPKYGEWQAYVPGPYQRPAWITPEDADSSSGSDALIAGAVYMVGGGPKLLTPLGEDAG